MLGPWLDMYQQSFPLNEQVLVSAFVRALQQGFEGESAGASMLVLEEEGSASPLGICWHELALGGRALWLYYIAVAPEARGQGVGARFYRDVVELAKTENPGLELMVFEVEHPGTLEGEGRALAERRIGFYRRLGAKLVSNIVYYQEVGWQPPVRMHLMAHPLSDIGEDAIADMLRELFGHLAEPFDRVVLE